MALSGPEKFAANVRWFMEHQDVLPDRLHDRGIWVDADGMGSALGSPDMNDRFQSWLERAERMTEVEVTTQPCLHVWRKQGELCPDCAVTDGQGNRIAETGRYRKEERIYSYPMTATLARLGRVPVKQGRPRLSVALRALARARGDVDATLEALAPSWPVLGHEELGRAYLAYALNRCRKLFRLREYTKVGSYVAKSDAQLDAEAQERG